MGFGNVGKRLALMNQHARQEEVQRMYDALMNPDSQLREGFGVNRNSQSYQSAAFQDDLRTRRQRADKLWGSAEALALLQGKTTIKTDNTVGSDGAGGFGMSADGKRKGLQRGARPINNKTNKEEPSAPVARVGGGSDFPYDDPHAEWRMNMEEAQERQLQVMARWQQASRDKYGKAWGLTGTPGESGDEDERRRAMLKRGFRF